MSPGMKPGAARSSHLRLSRHAGVLSALLLLAAAGMGSASAQSCSNTQLAATTPSADFEQGADGTAVHLPSGLHWMRCSLGQSWAATTCSGSALNLTQWRDALQLVRAVNLGESNADGDGAPGFAGHTDWRMPNIKELSSLHEACRRNPAINDQVFPNAPVQGVHWTSTTVHGSAVVAWFFDFGEARNGFALKSDSLPRFARLVRGGAGATGYSAGSNRVFADGFEASP